MRCVNVKVPFENDLIGQMGQYQSILLTLINKKYMYEYVILMYVIQSK